MSPDVCLALSNHAERRLAQRAIPHARLAYVLEHGLPVQRTGVTFYVLRDRDIPPEDRHEDAISRLAGTAVLIGANGRIITAYRHPNVLRTIQRKVKYRFAA